MPGDGEGGSDGGDSQGAIFVEFLKVVEPVVSAVQRGPMGVLTLLDEMGVSEEVIGQDASALYDELESSVSSNGGDIVETVVGMVEETDGVEDIESLSEIDDVDWGAVLEEVDIQDVESIVKSAKAIYDSFEALTEVELQFDADTELSSLGDAVMDYLLIRYLRTYRREVYGWCKTFGVIRSEIEGQERPETIDLGILVQAVQDPNEMPKELLNWGEEGAKFLATLLLSQLLETFWGMDVPAKLTESAEEEVGKLAGDVTPENLPDPESAGIDDLGQKLLVPLIGYQVDKGNRFETGVKIVPIPPKPGENQLPGVAFVTYGTIASGMGGKIGDNDDWKVSVDGSGHLANRGVAIRPSLSEGVTTELVNVEGSDATVSGSKSEDQLVFTLSLEYVGDSAQAKSTILGTAVGRLEMDGLDFTTNFEYANDEFGFAVELTTTGVIAIDPQGGFLDKVIPEPISYDFEVTVGWSTKSGFYLQNGGSLEIALADDLPLGPLNIKETFLGLELPDAGGGSGVGAGSGSGAGGGSGGGPPKLPTSIGSSPELDLGFMTARVERLGLKNEFAFPEEGGNLGPVDHSIGFRPPDGIALSVDAGPVSGGGVLNFYPEEKRYSGALQLQISELSITAVGLLKTELPGGRDGYSLLLLITAEFPPVQLGFGFTLNGLGGLLGIHRSMKSKPLGNAVRSGNVSSILFPKNVVENADRIISDLRTIFPPTADQHVVGPMAKFGWGTPTLMTMEVGVVLQFPTFKIAIVGAFHLNLPDEEAALVTLNLAVVGIVDPPNQKLAIDASLYDSRIVMWTVSGDMAMRLYWGDDSRFLLSVGGFHPRYDPPSGFPELDRVKASLGAPSGNPRLEYRGYLATTPNTFQVGAGVYLHAEAGPASVDGELSFDALFQFDPFKFIIDFMARLAVEIKGKGLEIKVDGTLMGPGPFRVKGTVTIDILFISISADIDVTIGSGGDKEKLPAAKVMPELLTELEKGGNWSAQLPDTGSSLVTIADSGDGTGGDGKDDGPVLVHPLGGLGVRQQVVPMNEAIEKFGEAVPGDYEKFRIAEVRVDDEVVSERHYTREKFAPAKFRKMSDSEKLNSPSFVKRDAGLEAGGSLLYYPGSDEETADRSRQMRRATRLVYETTVVDEERENHGEPLSSLGSYAAQPVAAARVGVPLGEVPEILAETAIADVELRRDFVTRDVPVYGTPGGTVIGHREGREVVEATAATTIDEHEAETAAATAGTDESGSAGWSSDVGIVTDGPGVSTLSQSASEDDS